MSLQLGLITDQVAILGTRLFVILKTKVQKKHAENISQKYNNE